MDIIKILSHRKKLDITFLGNRIFVFDQVLSTNDIAKKMKDFEEGTLVIAKNQLKGRGRRHSEWVSSKGNNILCTFTLFPNSFTVEILSLLAGLSVSQAIEDVTGIQADIKWPNDVMVSQKKVAGILVENRYQENNLLFSAIGIGINVNQRDFPDTLASIATSLNIQLKGKVLDLEYLLCSVLKRFESNYKRSLKESNHHVHRLCFEKMKGVNRRVSFQGRDGRYVGVLKGIDDQGRLCISVDSGDEYFFSQEDISLIRFLS